MPPGEHGLGSIVVGLLSVLFLSLLPGIVQSFLALIFGLFFVGLLARISKPILLEISEKASRLTAYLEVIVLDGANSLRL